MSRGFGDFHRPFLWGIIIAGKKVISTFIKRKYREDSWTESAKEKKKNVFKKKNYITLFGYADHCNKSG